MLDSVTGHVGKSTGKLAVTLSAAALIALVLLCVQAGRIVAHWESVGADVEKMVEGENPVLRRNDLIALSNQYVALSNQVTALSSQTTEQQTTTQAYVNSLRVTLAQHGIQTAPPPWEQRRFVITDGSKEN